MYPTADESCAATYREGEVVLEGAPNWPAGTRLVVSPAVPIAGGPYIDGHVIIVGFGLAGRCVADLLDRTDISYKIIEKNPVTVETQRSLGRDIIEGDATDAGVLMKAGLTDAAILALTIPDEDAVLNAIALARRLRPEIFIIARTNYSSKGMKAAQLGADEVIKAEQAVALQFHERLTRHVRQTR